MANYRQIHTKIWTDPWFIELEADEKLLFIYLFSNDRANLVGIYDISPKTIAHETDIPKERIGEILADFEMDGKVFRDGSWVWIVNLFNYNAHNLASPKIHTHIITCLQAIKNTNLAQQWLIRYGTILEKHGLDTVSYRMIPARKEQEQEQEQEIPESEKASDSGSASPKPTQRQIQDKARAELEDHFSEYSKIPKPNSLAGKVRKSTGELWWTPLREILKLVDWDVGSAKSLVDSALQKLDGNERDITISSPKSILKTAVSIHAKNARGTTYGGNKRRGASWARSELGPNNEEIRRIVAEQDLDRARIEREWEEAQDA